MAKIKRHFSTGPTTIIGSVGLLLLFVLWAASADPLTIEDENSAFTGDLPQIAGTSNPIQPSETAQSEGEAALLLLSTTNQAAPLSVSPDPARSPSQIVPGNLRLLDGPRQYALGMIETGNDDKATGRAGEVSRYQIMPSVWKCYSDSHNYHNADISLTVARQHWLVLHDYFKKRTNREPTDFDMYVLWNTRQGYYARRGFDPARVNPTIRDRAQRFTNLVELGIRREAGIANNKGV